MDTCRSAIGADNRCTWADFSAQAPYASWKHDAAAGTSSIGTTSMVELSTTTVMVMGALLLVLVTVNVVCLCQMGYARGAIKTRRYSKVVQMSSDDERQDLRV